MKGVGWLNVEEEEEGEDEDEVEKEGEGRRRHGGRGCWACRKGRGKGTLADALDGARGGLPAARPVLKDIER